MRDLLDKSGVAKILGVPKASVDRLLTELYGLTPYADFGPGRGLGKRWHPVELQEAMERVREKGHKKARITHRKRSADTNDFFSGSYTSAKKELTGKRAVQ